MVRNYETTFILTPVLNESEAKKAVKGYIEGFLKENGAEIVHEDHVGLKQLAYPINKKTTGIYHFVEFKAAPELIDKLELAFRRDENILRFMTVVLDKYAIKYNDDKRNGRIGRKAKAEEAETEKAEG